LVAQLAIETGIPPREFIEMDSMMIKAMLQVFDDQAKEAKVNANRSKRLR
jgi:hypothetical protein